MLLYTINFDGIHKNLAGTEYLCSGQSIHVETKELTEMEAIKIMKEYININPFFHSGEFVSIGWYQKQSNTVTVNKKKYKVWGGAWHE